MIVALSTGYSLIFAEWMVSMLLFCTLSCSRKNWVTRVRLFDETLLRRTEGVHSFIVLPHPTNTDTINTAKLWWVMIYILHFGRLYIQWIFNSIRKPKMWSSWMYIIKNTILILGRYQRPHLIIIGRQSRFSHVTNFYIISLVMQDFTLSTVILFKNPLYDYFLGHDVYIVRIAT